MRIKKDNAKWSCTEQASSTTPEEQKNMKRTRVERLNESSDVVQAAATERSADLR